MLGRYFHLQPIMKNLNMYKTFSPCVIQCFDKHKQFSWQLCREGRIGGFSGTVHEPKK